MQVHLVYQEEDSMIYNSILGILWNKSGPGTNVKAITLASVVGKIVSTSLAVGNITRLMTKAMHVCIESRTSWDSSVPLSRQAMSELNFWLKNIRILNFCKH